MPWARICRRGCWADALAIARAIGDEAARAEALAGLVPHLPRAEQPAVLAEALAAAPAIGNERDRVFALARLAPHLPPELLAEALAAARAITDHAPRAEALTALALRLPPDEQHAAFSEVLAALRAMPDEEWQRAYALAHLAPHLPPRLLAETATGPLGPAGPRGKHGAEGVAEVRLRSRMGSPSCAGCRQKGLISAPGRPTSRRDRDCSGEGEKGA